eukprot:4512046-Ditylum_brightwellii.AAC.1
MICLECQEPLVKRDTVAKSRNLYCQVKRTETHDRNANCIVEISILYAKHVHNNSNHYVPLCCKWNTFPVACVGPFILLFNRSTIQLIEFPLCCSSIDSLGVTPEVVLTGVNMQIEIVYEEALR